MTKEHIISKYYIKYKKSPVQVKATLWFLLCSFLQKGISTLTTPIFTRLLDTTEFGQYNTFNSWLGIFQVVLTLNIVSGVLTQELVKNEKERDEFSSSMQGLTITLCLFGSVIYLVFHHQLNYLLGLTSVQMIAMLFMIWATTAFGIWSVYQRVTYSYKKLVIITLIVSLAKPIISILLILNSEDKVTARILGLMIAETVGYSGVALYQLIKGKRFFSKKFWKYAIMLNVPLIPHALSQTILINADRIMIEKFIGNSEEGIYSLAYSVSQIMIIFNQSLGQTLAPWTYEKIKAKRVSDIKSVAYSTMIAIGVINLLMMLFAPEILFIFAPSSYHEAVMVIPPIAMATFFMYLYDWFARFEYYFEKSTWIMVASVTGAVLNIVLNYMLIPLWGYSAAAYTTLICYIVYSFMHFIFMRIICKKEFPNEEVYNAKFILGISVCFCVIGFIILFTYNYTFIRYTLIVCSLIWLLVMRNKIKKLIREIMKLRNNKKEGDE